MEYICDIAVLGGGPAGYVAAIRASQLGANVVLIEKNAMGGVCMNVGCIPTKALIKSADIYKETKKAKEFGVVAENVGTVWNTAVTRKNRIVKMLGKGVEHLMSANNITVVNGVGTVVSANEVSVKTEEDTQSVKCAKLIITTGSEPLVPSFIKGAGLEGVLTSTEALALTEVPKNIVIIGGGVIGIEFATMFSQVGAKVTVIELEPKILPLEDEDISADLLKILKKQGIKFALSSKVTEISKTENRLAVEYINADDTIKVECDNVLLSVGRVLNSGIASALNLNTEKGRIVVDEFMQTSAQNVYAAGDVIGGKLLAHLSFMEGRTAAENAMGEKNTVNYKAVPACVYTSPEVASVGMSEKEAVENGITPKVGRFDFRVNGRALTLGERDGYVKVIANEDGVIIGGQIFGANASEMISELTLAVSLGVSAKTMSDIIHPHPALNEAIWEACNIIAGKPIHM